MEAKQLSKIEITGLDLESGEYLPFIKEGNGFETMKNIETNAYTIKDKSKLTLLSRMENVDNQMLRM